MNAELPPFKNGEHNSDSASTLDRDITPLITVPSTLQYRWLTDSRRIIDMPWMAMYHDYGRVGQAKI